MFQSVSLAKFTTESKSLFVLSLPLIINNVIAALMTFIDFVMAGSISALDLAAVGIGNTIWAFVFLAGMGVLMAMSPVTAQLAGANDPAKIGRMGRQSLWLSLVISVLIFFFLRHVADDVMVWVGVESELIPTAYGYLRALAFGVFAMFAFLCLRYISEGISHTKPIMIVALIGLIINAFGNYVLMFGKFGAPELGAIGCGYASAIAMWISLIVMLLYVYRQRRVYAKLNLFDRFEWPVWKDIKELLAIGLPIGGSVTAEVGLFSAAGLIMGVLGTKDAAAHAVAINYAATMFMVPLALHSGIMIRVGHSVGSGRMRDARYSGWVGIALCGAFMTLSALVLLALREPITTFYVDDPEVRVIAAQLLLMATIFQITDGLQVGAAGALRGLKDTRVPLLVNIISFWAVGFPIAWYAGIHLGWRGQGVWAGLAFGLTVAAVLLCLRFYRISHKH